MDPSCEAADAQISRCAGPGPRCALRAPGLLPQQERVLHHELLHDFSLKLMYFHGKSKKTMDFHDFPRFLGKSWCRSHPPPKLCAGLTWTIFQRGLFVCVLRARTGGITRPRSRTHADTTTLSSCIVPLKLIWYNPSYAKLG